jgi:hypothetical protein
VLAAKPKRTPSTTIGKALEFSWPSQPRCNAVTSDNPCEVREAAVAHPIADSRFNQKTSGPSTLFPAVPRVMDGHFADLACSSEADVPSAGSAGQRADLAFIARAVLQDDRNASAERCEFARCKTPKCRSEDWKLLLDGE